MQVGTYFVYIAGAVKISNYLLKFARFPIFALVLRFATACRITESKNCLGEAPFQLRVFQTLLNQVK